MNTFKDKLENALSEDITEHQELLNFGDAICDFKTLNHLFEQQHKLLSLNTDAYFKMKGIEFDTRYNTLYPYQNPVYLMIDGIKYAYNASKIQFKNSDIVYYPSHCPILDGYKMPDIDLFLKMLIDNNICLLSLPITFEPSKTYLWFPTDTVTFKIYNTDNLLQFYEDKTKVRKCHYELSCLNKITIVDYIDKDKDETAQTESIKIYFIQIHDKLNNIKHIIKIFHYNNWPDMNVPTRINLIYQYIYMLYQSIIRNDNKKILVHCSAGIGRTGTIITILNMINYIDTNIIDIKTLIKKSDYTEKDINILILSTIMYLRQYRPLMVQKESQYNLIINIIKFFLNLNKYNRNKLITIYILHTRYIELPKCGEDNEYWRHTPEILFK